MTDYTKTTDFTSKDSLPSGDSGKIIRGAEFGTEFDNIETAVNSKSNIENPVFTGTITGNGSGITNVAAASIDLTVSSDTDADYNVPFMNATGDGGSAKVLQVDDNGLMFNPNSNTLRVNRLKGSNDNLLIQDTSGNTILDIDANALEIPVNTTITGTTAVTGNITVTGTVDGRDVATDGTKLDTVETNADVTDATNVTAAGALMDSELTDIAAVKALNQGVATTDSPTFAGATVNGTVEFDGLSGTGAVTVTDILDQDDMSGNSATALATQQSIKSYVDSQVATSDTLAEVLANGNTTGGTDVAFGDNDKAVFGAGSDLEIYHSSNQSIIKESGAGSLLIQGDNIRLQKVDGSENMITAVNDGAVTLFDNGSAKLATTSTGIDVSGVITTDGMTTSANINFGDNDKAVFGAGSDLEIYHDGSNSVIHDNGTGNLNIIANEFAVYEGNGTDLMIGATPNGAVTLSHNAQTKLATSSTGIDVTGTVSADALTIGGTLGNFDISTGGNQATFDYNGFNYINFSGSGAVLAVRRTGGLTTTSWSSNGDINLGYEDTGTTAKLFWDASAERLGIGNSAPTTALDVTGTVTADGLTVTGTLGNWSIDSQGVVQTFTRPSANYIRASDASGSLRFDTGGNLSRMNIASNGDVSLYEDTGTTAKLFWDASAESLGIGTSSPAYPLAVYNDTGSGIVASFGRMNAPDEYTAIGLSGFTAGNDATKAGLALKRAGTFGTGELHFLNNNTLDDSDMTLSDSKMMIDTSGNVGIGTDSPDALLELAANNNGSENNTLRITDTDTFVAGGDTLGKLEFYATDGAAVKSFVKAEYANAQGDAELVLGTSSSASAATERMRIDSSGHLLVGTTSASGASAPDNSGTASDAGIRLSPTGFIGLGANQAPSGYFNRIGNDGDIIKFNKDGTTVGSIGTNSGLFIGSTYGNDAGIRFASDIIAPSTTTGANRDAAIDLGASGARFKDLYLSGGVYIGGTAAANKLDDYEEGTFTPTVYSSDNTTVLTSGVDYALNDYRYVKVGRHVMMEVRIQDLRATKTSIFCTIPFTSLTSDSGVGITAEGDVIYLASNRLNFRKGTNQYPYGIVNFESS